MTKHNDDDPVILEYSSSTNISFHGETAVGITWSEWREMSDTEKNEAITDVVFNGLIDVNVAGDED